MQGIGDSDSRFVVYIGNCPDFADLGHLDGVRALKHGDIAEIGKQCGNGWRKVFNVYAKLVFALQAKMHACHKFNSWQHWRDKQLLQAGSDSLLLFSPPKLDTLDNAKIHIVMGKGWAGECGLNDALIWLNQDFALIKDSHHHQLVVCPYFDYRQLSNQKIMYLCELLSPLLNGLLNPRE